MANQVMLTFAGETRSLEQAFATADAAAGAFGDSAHRASMRMAEGFDYASSQSSMLSGGIGDVGGALTAAFGEESGIGQFGAEMERYGTIIMGLTGVSDLLLFATNNLKLGVLAKAAADRVAAGATRAWTAAQWLFSASLWASPITWIVVGIVALIAVIVLIARKTDWFSTAWRASWKWIRSAASNTWDFLKKIPGWIGNAFAVVGRFITAPFRAAFNYVARGWNSTLGGLSFTIPSWIPGIGGNSFSMPRVPTFHSGTRIVPGVPGTAVPALLQAGEEVRPVTSAGRGGDVVRIGSDGSRLGDALIEIIGLAMRRHGGDPRALGIAG